MNTDSEKTKENLPADETETASSNKKSIDDVELVQTAKPFDLKNPFAFHEMEKTVKKEQTPPTEPQITEEKLSEVIPEPAVGEAEDPETEGEEARQQRAEEEYEQALAAADLVPQMTTCDELRALEALLVEGKSPLFHNKEVLVPRDETLRLISGLTALCTAGEEDGEDDLFDRLVSSDHDEDVDYKPLYRVKDRAKTIIDDAMRQADIIVGDAKVLSNKLLQHTESSIQEKYDLADEEIAVRLNTTKEESAKRLTEARDELTASRKQSVDILNLYMNKAEDDYQGYWERAEQTLMASLSKSEAVLSKACDIYERELAVIREDLQTIENVLEELSRYRRK